MEMPYDYGVPEIYEFDAKGNLNHLYHDIQFVLKVPVVNFIFRTLALYETFLSIAWGQVRPNMLTNEMEAAARQLRYPNLTVDVPKINWNYVYDLSTIERIKRVIFTFNYVNPKLLLIACSWAESLSNRPIRGSQNYSELNKPGVIEGLPKIHLVNLNDTDFYVQRLLADIMKTHHAYDAASDYRALANYPEFLSESWKGLKPYVGSNEYNLQKANLKTEAIELVHDRMAFPVTVNPDSLHRIYNSEDIAGIMAIVSMFQNLLPSLIIEGEYFRRMID